MTTAAEEHFRTGDLDVDAVLTGNAGGTIDEICAIRDRAFAELRNNTSEWTGAGEPPAHSFSLEVDGEVRHFVYHLPPGIELHCDQDGFPIGSSGEWTLQSKSAPTVVAFGSYFLIMSAGKVLRAIERAAQVGKAGEGVILAAIRLARLEGYLHSSWTHESFLGMDALLRLRKGAAATNEAHTEQRPDYQPRVEHRMAEGLSYTAACEQVASSLGVSSRTVQNHTTNPAPRNRGKWRG